MINMDIGNLSSFHFDILREIGNIGSGNAVTALAQLLNKKIDMDVPSVRLVEFKDIADSIGGAENIVIGILVEISGDIKGMMMFVVKEECGHKLISYLMGQPIGASGEFTEMDLSALKEVGNILASSYLGSFASLINKRILPSIPFLAIDMANAILSVPAIEFGKMADSVLFIESIFSADSDKISGYFLLIPDPPSFQLILSSLGVE